MKDMKPLIVKASRHHDQSIADRQFSIEQSDYEPGDFGKKYVSFSGYFGEAGPHVFAAAPELLEALTMGAEINTPDLMDWIADRLVFVHKENPNIDFVKSLRNRAATARAAIAKAKGEQK